ncbi:MAG: ChaN family lipoprotein [Thiolinea sp.]
MKNTRPLNRLFRSLLSVCILGLCTLSVASATVLTHKTQQDVLTFLDDYQPEIISAERKLPFKALIGELEDKKVIFVGEKHDRYDHHLNQLAILRALHQQNPELAIGLEWFQQPFQPVLDDYLAGTIDEAELLDESGYYQRWRYDFRMLRPVLEYARANKLPVIALNAAQEITAKVSEKGLEGLDKSERAQLPDTIHPPQPNYRAYLEGVFKEHMRGHGDPTNFILVQRIWDETMAMNIVKHLQAHPQQRMVVFAGSGHLGPAAIPGDVARSIPQEKLATLHSVEREDIEPGSFDYFILSAEKKLPPTGKLGAWLDDQPDNVSIIKLAENSAAGKAGLQQGDRIASINQQKIGSMAQLLSLLAQRQPGDEVEVMVERANQQFRYVFPLQ